MAQITVTINGRSFRMACDDGEEERLLGLAQRFDDSINILRGNFGEIGDLRLTVMAGIMAMDQKLEMERRLERLQSERDQEAVAQQEAVSSLQSRLNSFDAEKAEYEQRIAEKLSEAAEKIESLADGLAGGLRDDD
ncbi:cell division protein ZapA [Rhodobacteraceae bacterium RKSG542]|uniref:cell division protein ZapA n=1 Tax=Pseudovibrio flavus TaxID=2529854 RepID=UPI0012BD1F6B|nr:cell division protein ZapA [Pseudovibrio flavus]MTI16590.1 cell division protein ZapA [Pseudovibrio flavus]